MAGVPERNLVTHDAGPTEQPRPLDCVLAEAVADGVDRRFEPIEARARGPTGSPAALSAPITSAAVEKEIRSILLGLIPTCVLTGKPEMREVGQRTQPVLATWVIRSKKRRWLLRDRAFPWAWNWMEGQRDPIPLT